MGLFNSEEKKKQKEEERKLDEQLAKVSFFPGSIVEYQNFRGYEVRIINTDAGPEMGVTFYATEGTPFVCQEPLWRKQTLVDDGIEAIVNCQLGVTKDGVRYSYRYGLPVARKNG